MRVQVTAQPNEKLALAGPSYVDDAYQLFSDGALVGSFGKFSGHQPTFYFTRPMMFDLPAVSAQSPSSVRVLAFRLWMAPDTMVTQADTGACIRRRCWAMRALFPPGINCIGSNLSAAM
jgi:hypothetical protein